MTAQFSFSDVRYSALNRNGTRNKRLWTILFAVFFFLVLALIHIHFLSRLQDDRDTKITTPANCIAVKKELDEKKKTVGENWIVVTTINQPTDAMDLLCNLEGWNVVVVADTKSPTDWTCGSCVYLSVEDQKCLSYGIVEVIPYKAYTRKNIGYLWAIQHGATKVFDTDDDNLPTGKDIIFEAPTSSVVGYHPDNTTGKSVNIYSHFGRPDIWPRGFPLEEIDVRRPTSYLPEYESLPVQVRDVLAPPMMIQQGLADLDPDVDAIFRLTQVQELKQAKFCKMSPSIRLSPGTFCPFNSQNTLFSYDAFWGLVLPITVSFRVCDIWRGYWVQRLLWDVNGSLGFTKPTVDQIRNAHNYLDDYMDELKIYAETSKFIDFLSSWKSTSTHLEDRIVDLMKAMAENKFVEYADVDLAERWVKDLKSVGYKFPKVSGFDPQAVASAIDAYQEPRPRLQKAHQQSIEALKQCQAEVHLEPTMSRIQITGAPVKEFPADRFKDILLVVNFNHPTYAAIEPFLSIYKPYFPNIKFYGPAVPNNLKDIVTEINHNAGTTGYQTLISAVEHNPQYAGYLYTNDDTVLNVFQLAEFDQDKVWKKVPDVKDEVHDRTKTPPVEWYWWNHPESVNMWNDPTALTAVQKQRIEAFTNVHGLADIKAWVDAVYVPRRISVEVTDILRQFLKHKVFLELSVATALVAVEPTADWNSWTESYLWDGDRLEWRNFLRQGASMIHPVKLLQDKNAWKEIALWIETVKQ
ncbi:hypothetical protein BGZ52_003934 [Haplosporangium bisporale]|nr:hypothetical protein BGZ52_003934 [Haplosporangium bisporale]KFH66141.1 hypothetical protein MVEG_08242 [Podila verticillata NRRL 6337]